MSLAVVYSRAHLGIEAPQVTVEVHLSRGLPAFHIVGLAATAVKESRDRVRSAILNNNFSFPAKRIVVNLAPADLPKDSSRFDLAIAIGILIATQQLPDQVGNYEFAGELSLTGELLPVRSMLPFAIATQHQQRSLILPIKNTEEAALVNKLAIYPARHLLEVCAHIMGQRLLSTSSHTKTSHHISYPSIDDVIGQQQAKRALMIAAAGQHSLLMTGSPGTGKTMLANRLAGLLPLLNESAALETAAIYSLTPNGFDTKNWRKRPFRAPHHSASPVAIIGGGKHPSPGEISLAHHGILFLDELPEFNRQALEGLREPLETGFASISRANYQVKFPANFQLIAAMNPCPCGYDQDPDKECNCTPDRIARYQQKISGPLLDRMDLQIAVNRVNHDSLIKAQRTASQQTLQSQIKHALQIQMYRARKVNAKLTTKELTNFCSLNTSSEKLVIRAMQQLKLSARAYHRMLKVARTIADLEQSVTIQEMHIQEALGFRMNNLSSS